MSFSSVYSKIFVIPSSAIDENGHVNNVAYVQWMQDIAVEHYSSIGGIQAQGADATWVVREHKIEYLLPAFAGEEIEIRTWVENIRRVRSLRKYEFIRKTDGRILVRGETDWVFVDTKTGIPRAVPAEVSRVFQESLVPWKYFVPSVVSSQRPVIVGYVVRVAGMSGIHSLPKVFAPTAKRCGVKQVARAARCGHCMMIGITTKAPNAKKKSKKFSAQTNSTTSRRLSIIFSAIRAM